MTSLCALGVNGDHHSAIDGLKNLSKQKVE